MKISRGNAFVSIICRMIIHTLHLLHFGLFILYEDMVAIARCSQKDIFETIVSLNPVIACNIVRLC